MPLPFPKLYAHAVWMGFRAGPISREAQLDPKFIQWVAATYRDDPYGYGIDILGNRSCDQQKPVMESVRDHKRTAASSGHGTGKGLHVDEPVLTPGGWRPIGTVRPGDRVAAVDGSFTEVLGVYPQGERDIFRVLLDDGCWVVCDDEHLWFTRSRSERKHGKPGTVRTTPEIAASLNFPNGPRVGLNHMLPTCALIRHPVADLPFDPYVLGFWLGDGSCDGALTVSATKRDHLRGFAGLVSDIPDSRNENVRTVRIEGLAAAISDLEKFVPARYLHGSIGQRLALLQGLLDSDGTIGRRSSAVTFDTSSERLADAVAELTRSLGGVARRGGRQGRLNGVDKRWSYRVYVALPDGMMPFRLPYKTERYRPADHKNRERVLRRFIKAVEPVGRAETICIKVAHPSELFVTRDHIVTHNTRTAATLIHWFIATRPHPAIIATANTESQLQKKLWRELAKVNRGARNGAWFEWKTSTFTAFKDPTAQAVALAWSAENPEAFAGTHEEHVLGVFDEASAIPRTIFNVFEGAMTTAGARWVLFGNPTRSEGFFFDACHGKLKARRPGDLGEGLWNSFILSSAESRLVDAAWVESMRAQHGDTSDEYRIRVLGLPPRFDSEQFIPQLFVAAAMEREVDLFDRWPLVLGCDVGVSRDRSAIVPRRGRKVLDRVQIVKGERTTDFARRIAEEIHYWREEKGLEAQAVIEELGMGIGVVETLEDMGYADNTHGVNTGEQALEPELYLNLRCEMWGRLREWLEEAVELPNVPELYDDLVMIKRKPNVKLQLESKQEMRKRGVKSPDLGDALALTFAVPFDLLPLKKDAWAEAFAGSGMQQTSWMAA